MTQTIDPVFSSAVLSAPELALNDLDFDALSQAMGGLKGEVDKNPQTAAIILAGGTGERFGKEGGKQLVEIAGKPILTWSAEAFDAVGDIGLPRTAAASISSAPSTRSRSSRPSWWRLRAPAVRNRRSRGWSSCRTTTSTSSCTTAPARSSAPTSSRIPSPR